MVSKWKRWFAWRPIWVPEHGLVWLSYIKRKTFTWDSISICGAPCTRRLYIYRLVGKPYMYHEEDVQ